MYVDVSEEQVAAAILEGNLDLCATLTCLLFDEDNLDRVCRHISNDSTASVAERTVPGRLRYLADALEQTQSEA